MPLARAAGDLLVAQHAQAKGVDQRVALVGLVEIDLAGDGRDAEAIAVMGDAGHHAAEEPAIVRCADLVAVLAELGVIGQTAAS